MIMIMIMIIIIRSSNMPIRGLPLPRGEGDRRRLRPRDLQPDLGKGEMGSALMGSLRIPCRLTEGLLGCSLLLSSQSARAYLSVKTHYSCSSPISNIIISIVLTFILVSLSLLVLLLLILLVLVLLIWRLTH